MRIAKPVDTEVVDDPCETCDGTGVLIGDTTDGRGQRTDYQMPCPDCGPHEPDDYEHETELEREHNRNRFDFGGES